MGFLKRSPLIGLDGEPFWNHNDSMNVTLKDVPPELHERIKEAAAHSGRSLNRQIIFTLEASLGSTKTPKDELVQANSAEKRPIGRLCWFRRRIGGNLKAEEHDRR